MRKIDEIEQPTSCLNKARAEEPLFVLRARDPLAPDTVRIWANAAEIHKTHEPAKIAEARALADQMDAYAERNCPWLTVVEDGKQVRRDSAGNLVREG